MPTDPSVYLDNAATTRPHPAVLEAMQPYLSPCYGNPSSLYALAQEAREALDVAREQLARFVGARRSEIVFTAGGTEADNAALKGAAFALREHGRHIVISEAEHHAVLHSAEQLERLGWEISLARVDHNGVVDPQEVVRLVRPDTTVVSIMLVNNEVGAINPIGAIGRAVRTKLHNHKSLLLLHTDAVQAAGKLPIDVAELGVDLLSLSGHKIYAPKGVGALYVKRGTPLEPLLSGGGQERQRRAGTENVAAIVGMGVATELVATERQRQMGRLGVLRDRLLDGILKIEPATIVNGDPTQSVETILNVSFKGLGAESILIALDMGGVCVSSGSACSSASLEPSHVLIAIGRDANLAVASIRFSLGRDTTAAHIETTLRCLAETLPKLRAMPLAESAQSPV